MLCAPPLTAIKSVVELRPLDDPRWNDLVMRHPQSSIYHSLAWLDALHRTYGYRPVALSTLSDDGGLEGGLLFCEIDSWITGRRWVSLPFSEHCAPLLNRAADLQTLLPVLERLTVQEQLRYLEIRPLQRLPYNRAMSSDGYWEPGMTYCFHRLDLTPDLNSLFCNFHKSSTQRKICRARRENLRYEEGRSEALLKAFYRLLILTRRRHGLPPQPWKWFSNLVESFGEALKIRVAFQERQAIAAMLTIRHKDTLVYKYGCSDAAYNNLGGMHLLFWKSIEEAKREGLRTFDLGRSDIGNQGLIAFKNRWGAASTILSYSVFTPSTQASVKGVVWKERPSKRIVGHLPSGILRLIGNLAYKHIG
jgi:CelD/BcsL family acetyltransferase involved in cellulose biosynthesis